MHLGHTSHTTLESRCPYCATHTVKFTQPVANTHCTHRTKNTHGTSHTTLQLVQKALVFIQIKSAKIRKSVFLYTGKANFISQVLPNLKKKKKIVWLHMLQFKTLWKKMCWPQQTCYSTSTVKLRSDCLRISGENGQISWGRGSNYNMCKHVII